MFKPTKIPRVFGLPPGADFADALVAGLTERTKHLPPEGWAQVQIYVNTSRIQRRLRDVFDSGPPRLLPQIRLITDLSIDAIGHNIPPAISPLRRRLELSQFVAALLTQEPDLAPHTALYDLSDSLAKLMDEMHSEGVTPDVLSQLDVGDQSEHWERALRFLNILKPFFNTAHDAPDKEARQRLLIDALIRQWEVNPPQKPIIIAGSTGSRGATSMLIRAISKLPQGAVILPGFDFDLKQNVWENIADEDHPQFRFQHLMSSLQLNSTDIELWAQTPTLNGKRNQLISLSLRPAPVTHQWLEDGPNLGNLMAATSEITLLEATSPRAEAETIALRLRQAAEDGKTAALITPDRMLTRQVAAALDRWDIQADDSAGMPLSLSPPGRLLRHVVDIVGVPITAEQLFIILKHPLCNSGKSERGQHLLYARELELHMRRRGTPFPTPSSLLAWAKDDPARIEWAVWIGQLFKTANSIGIQHLTEHLALHMKLAYEICAGPKTDGSGALWDEAAGREANNICESLTQNADAGGTMTNRDYSALFGAVLAEGVVRDRDKGHPNILIWGTLEARVQGADLVILGGMNEGVWPEAPSPDPWLNRKMRADAGLLLPERRIGLAAHDYQQAIAAAEVWISRAKRSADAETVPSRWVNRLVNLLTGLPEQNGPQALQAMLTRGEFWASKAAKLAQPDIETPSAKRPSPRPPVAARPTEISVTQVKTLIRDPFAFYAAKVLRLKPLDPLVPQANAPLRGVIMHSVLEKFINTHPDASDPSSRDTLMQIAKSAFAKDCPWPTIRAQWMARLEGAADKFLSDEIKRQNAGALLVTEAWGEILVPNVGVKLTCKADRIDQNAEGDALIYDYKTGAVPSVEQQKKFDKQLLLEAAMVEHGAFSAVGKRPTKIAAFLGVNATMKTVAAPLKDFPPERVWSEFETLLFNWQQYNRGYSARIAIFKTTDNSPYDHLSRYGEWDMSDDAAPEDLR